MINGQFYSRLLGLQANIPAKHALSKLIPTLSSTNQNLAVCRFL